MKPLLIIKTGSALPSLRAAKGDFEDWVGTGLGWPDKDQLVIDVQAGEPLPGCEEVSGIVITGSHDMVTDHAPWSESTAVWLAAAVAARRPVLGICYGHQLLAYALGGQVGDNPRGHECGTVPIFREEVLTPPDPLLGKQASPFLAQVSHHQSVLRLPPGALRLAWSRQDPHQAFRYGERAWGVQFHPEFDAEVVRAYLRHDRALIEASGQDPESLECGCRDTFSGTEILQNFAKVVQGSSQ